MKKIFLFLPFCLIFFTACYQEEKEVKFYGNVDVRTVSLAFRVSGRLETLNFEETLQRVKIDKKDSYLLSYPFFINYFEEIKILNIENIILWSYFVYGWMPTILKRIDLGGINDIVEILQRAKKWIILEKDELFLLKKYLNNSIIGVSKLLHFINPELYPIWDSKIAVFLGKKNYRNINNIDSYIEYMDDLQKLGKLILINTLWKYLEEKLGYKITNIRTIEFILFQAGNTKNAK